MHRSIEERVDLWQQFYARKNNCPLFGFFAGSEYPLHRYRAVQSLPEHRALTPEDFNVATVNIEMIRVSILSVLARIFFDCATSRTLSGSTLATSTPSATGISHSSVSRPPVDSQ